MTGAVHAAVRPVRDRATLLAYAQLGLLGWFVYSFGASLTLLRDEQGLTRTGASLLSISLAIGGVLGSLMAAPFVRRFSRGTLLRTGSACFIVGALIYISGLPFSLILLGPFIGSIGTSFAAVGCSAYLEAHQGAAADAAITEGNTVASVGSLVGPFLVGVGAATIFGWRIGMLCLVVALLILEALRGRRTSAFNVGGEPAKRGVGRAPLPALVWWAVLTLILLTSVEMVFIAWGADLLRVQGGLGAAAASASLVAIVLGMILGRVTGSFIVERVVSQRVLAGAIVVALVGFVITWATANPVVMLVGMLITGIGMGTHFPLGISRAMRASRGQPDRAAGMSSAGIGITSGVSPFLLAALADQWGVHGAFLIVPVFFGLAFILLLLKPVPEDEPLPA